MSKSGYAVIWVSMDGNMERGGFASSDAARDWAESEISPESANGGRTIPNHPRIVDGCDEDDMFEGRFYSCALYCHGATNKYAVVVTADRPAGW